MQLMKVNDVADVLGVSEARVYELVREEILPAVRLGRTVRVSEAALQGFSASGGKSLPGGWRREPVEPQRVAG